MYLLPDVQYAVKPLKAWLLVFYSVSSGLLDGGKYFARWSTGAGRLGAHASHYPPQ